MIENYSQGQEKWLRAGFDILVKSGPQAITLESLGKKLKLSKGSFYHHFKNRDDFLKQLVRYWEASMTDWVIDTTQLESASHSKRLIKLAELTCRVAAMPIERAIQHWAMQNPDVNKALKRVEKKRCDYLLYLLKQAGVNDPLLVSRIIYSIFIGAQHLDPPTTDKEMLKMYEQIIPLKKKEAEITMQENRLDLNRDWQLIRTVFKRAQNAGLCHTFSSINQDGTPNITPIGSLVLADNSPTGIYFDVFNRSLADNLDVDPNVAILAVDSRKLFWLRSFMARKFSTPPAIRLVGKVSSKRRAEQIEINHSLDEIKTLKRLGASKTLGKRLKNLREITFTRVDVLNIGKMTNHGW